MAGTVQDLTPVTRKLQRGRCIGGWFLLELEQRVLSSWDLFLQHMDLVQAMKTKERGLVTLAVIQCVVIVFVVGGGSFLPSYPADTPVGAIFSGAIALVFVCFYVAVIVEVACTNRGASRVFLTTLAIFLPVVFSLPYFFISRFVEGCRREVQ